MVNLVETSLKELSDSSCISIESTGEIGSTALGKIMSYYYLSHKTIRYLVKHAKRNATFSDVLSWVSHATEYDELPVRHNEDLINAELERNLPLKADAFGLPMWDPHIKAFLLLQAHFSRIDLPISDYVGDANSVLDQSIRIVQASIDVLTELGYLSSCEIMITLLQCIKSARWPDDGPLAIFPGVNVEKEKKRVEHPKAAPKSLVEATTTPNGLLEKAARCAGVNPDAMTRFLEPVGRLPNVKVALSAINAIKVDVQLSRQNSARMTAGGVRIFAPRYPKPQTEGFFVILTYPSSDEIIALKRVNWQEGRGGRAGSARLQALARIGVPGDLESRKLDIVVLSDGYIGMKWKLESVEVPEAPVVEYDGKKEKNGDYRRI